MTGTGRCGTVYMARLLTSLGIMCGHEAVFTHEGGDKARQLVKTRDQIRTSAVSGGADDITPDWFDASRLRADSSFLAAPYLSEPPWNEVDVVHVVRHPLHVISSFVEDMHFFRDGPTPFSPSRDFLVANGIRHLMTPPDEIQRACLYWVEWNELIERQLAGRAALRCRVEDQPSQVLLEFLNVPEARMSQAFSNRAANSWKRRERNLGLDDVPDGTIKDRMVTVAQRYGYRLGR